MHYYKKNIGDYAKKAGRLSMLQHGAYTLLIDACYDRERFPTLEEALEWTWASTEAEIEAVSFVLKKFFTANDDGVYEQKRIIEELAKYHETAKTNKRIAIERETKRRENSTKRARPVNEPPPNQEPRTNNQEPLTNNQTSKQGSDKSAHSSKRFIPPTLEEVAEYCNERKNNIDPQAFIDHYETNGWVRGKTKIKNWKACVHTWESNQRQRGKGVETTAESVDRIKAQAQRIAANMEARQNG